MPAPEEFEKTWNMGYLGLILSLMQEELINRQVIDLPDEEIERVLRRCFTRALMPDLSEMNSLLRCWLADGMPEEGWHGEEGTLMAG